MGAETRTYVITRTSTQLTKDCTEHIEPKPAQYDTPSKMENLSNGNRIIETVEEDTIDTVKLLLPSQIGTDPNFKRKIVWFNALGFLYIHIIGAYGLYLAFTGQCMPITTVYTLLVGLACGVGTTMGAHRLFSHRSYKAVPSLRLFLLLLQTVAGQNCLYVWARDHRQHHKYSDTDADPHNATRGFFFSHIGWLMTKKHPKVFEYGKKIDMSDLEADYWVMFQKRYYKTLYTIFAFIIPTVLPMYLWNESFVNSVVITFFARTILQLNITWSVNSYAHMFGTKPYDKNMLPVQSHLVGFFGIGEGWHNYHHAFPWDYRAAELGMPYNLTTTLIDLLARFGYVYDRKCASETMIKSRIARTGDGSHPMHSSFALKDNIEDEERILRKYIVGKKEANGKLLMEQLEKDVKCDDLNNNSSKKGFKDAKKDFNSNEQILHRTKASLNGDSGGASQLKTLTVFGIVSFGVGHVCGVEPYAVYSDVRKFITWIRENVK